MIFDTSKITFELIRGDTFILPIILNEGSREYFKAHYLQDDEILYIGLMKPDESFEHATIRSSIDKNGFTDSFGNKILRWESDLTERLEPGKYYLSIKLASKEGVFTLVDHKIFYVLGSPLCE